MLGLSKILILRNYRLIKVLKKQKFFNALVLKYRYIVLDDDSDCTMKVLFTVSKKLIRKSVDRNLIRRRMKESFRLNKYLINTIPEKLLLIEIIYSSNAILSYTEINESVIDLMRQINIKFQ